MFWLFVLLPLTISHTLAQDFKDCNDGVLLVGGTTTSGPSSKISLLKPTGVCEHSGFPDLPEPLTLSSPAAYSMSNVLLVCGFSGNHSCKYTERGWNTWKNSEETTGDTYFHKMVYSYKVGSAMMTSFGNGNHLQHNPYIHNPISQDYHWMSMVGSPFSLSGVNLRSCLVAYDGDLLLMGGRHTQYCERCHHDETRAYVGKWSVSGQADGMGPPKFENGVVENMIEAREAHACAEFDNGVIVSGGYFYRHHSPNAPQRDLKSSAEFYDGETWIKMQNMNTVRAYHQLQTMCGAAVAIGGTETMGWGGSEDSTLLNTVELTWSAYGVWIPAPYMDLPEPLAYAASSPVSNMDCWTGEE